MPDWGLCPVLRDQVRCRLETCIRRETFASLLRSCIDLANHLLPTSSWWMRWCIPQTKGVHRERLLDGSTSHNGGPQRLRAQCIQGTMPCWVRHAWSLQPNCGLCHHNVGMVLAGCVRLRSADKEGRLVVYLSFGMEARPLEMVWSSDSAVDNALVWIVFRLCPWLHVGERLARQQRWIPDWKFAVLHHIWIERDFKMRPILILIHYFSSNMNNNSILLNYYVS